MLPTHNPILWRCRFPFVYFTLSFITGIVSGSYIDSIWVYRWVVIVFISLGVFYIGLVMWLHRSDTFFDWVGLVGLVCIFLAGYTAVSTKEYVYNGYHLRHKALGVDAYEAVVVGSPETKKNTGQVTLALKKVRTEGIWRYCEGKLALRWLVDEHVCVKYGDVVLVCGKPKEIDVWVGENMFDYKGFLQGKGVLYSHFVQGRDVRVIGYQPGSRLMVWALKMQGWLASRIEENMPDAEARGVVLALLLGMRNGLDRDVQRMYIGAGVVHVLAVSGLHVGLFYMLILYLLMFLGLRRKKFIHGLISLFLLWSYAWITGFSPSVLRAVSMFSLFTIGSILGHKSHSINALAAAAFLHLMYNPRLVFDIGFQLSYTAVLGIICLQPMWYRCCTFRALWIKKVWRFITVCLAAQLATLPLTLYYFHFFPVYFLLANAVVLPLAPIILGLGLLIILASCMPGISFFVGKITTQLIYFMHRYMDLIDQLPGAHVRDAYLAPVTVGILYGILIGIWLFMHKRKLIYLLASTGLALIIATKTTYAWLKPYQAWIFYSYPKQRTIAFVHDQKATLVAADKKHIATYHGRILPHLKKLGIQQVHPQERGWASLCCKDGQHLKLIALYGKKGLWLDGTHTMIPALKEAIYLDFVWVEENVVEDLNVLLASYKVGLLVIDATNTLKVVNGLKKQAKAKNIPYAVLVRNTACCIKA